MANAIEVSDHLSNSPEQIKKIAKVVGSGQRRKVFEAIYFHKKQIKAIPEIVTRSGVPRLRVLQEARELCRKGVVKSAPKQNGEVAYEMIEAIHAHKREILRYAADPAKLAKLSTKHQPSITVNVKGAVSRGSSLGRPVVKKITVDDIDSFKAVKGVRPDGNLPESLSETVFKKGLQAIIGEAADWKDWGGELFDVATTRVVLDGKRISSVFALKGPGTKGALVPGKMGKNGDQIQRMYLADAKLFVVQYWRDVKPSIDSLMRSMAVEKANATGEKIYYAVMDGADSHRLYRAYSSKFSVGKATRITKKTKRRRGR